MGSRIIIGCGVVCEAAVNCMPVAAADEMQALWINLALSGVSLAMTVVTTAAVTVLEPLSEQLGDAA